MTTKVYDNGNNSNLLVEGNKVGIDTADNIKTRGYAHFRNKSALKLAANILLAIEDGISGRDVDVTAWLYEQLAQRNAKAIPVATKSMLPPAQGFTALSPQAQDIVKYIRKAGSISARDAVNDLGITSSVLTRRLTDIERAGFKVVRTRKVHGVTQKRYTRYTLEEN